MIQLRQILGCTHCGTIFHVLRYKIRCPNCGYGLRYAEKIAFFNFTK